MRGLYRREYDEVIDADGWHHTGDKCVVADESIHFISRFTDMIKGSGSNVAPIEVERVLLAMPEVQESVVFGMPDPRRGELVVAVVVRVPGVDIDEPTLQDRARGQLSNYKVPRHVLILDDEEMPRLHSGKPDKQTLTTMMANRLTMVCSTTARHEPDE